MVLSDMAAPFVSWNWLGKKDLNLRLPGSKPGAPLRACCATFGRLATPQLEVGRVGRIRTGDELPLPDLQSGAFNHSATTRLKLVPTITIRTDDRPLTKRLLCQLSYAGETGGPCRARTGDLTIMSRRL